MFQATGIYLYIVYNRNRNYLSMVCRFFSATLEISSYCTYIHLHAHTHCVDELMLLVSKLEHSTDVDESCHIARQMVELLESHTADYRLNTVSYTIFICSFTNFLVERHYNVIVLFVAVACPKCRRNLQNLQESNRRKVSPALHVFVHSTSAMVVLLTGN